MTDERQKMTSPEDIGENGGSAKQKRRSGGKLALALAGIIILIVAAVFAGWKLLGPDQGKIDAATESLALASRGLALNNEVAGFGEQIAANPRGVYLRQLTRAKSELKSLLRDISADAGQPPQLQKATTTSLRAANQMAAVAEQLQIASEELRKSEKEQAERLDKQAERLAALRRQLRIERFLRQAIKNYNITINLSIEVLDEEGGLGQETEESINQSQENIEDSLASIDEVDNLVGDGLEETSEDLASESYDLRSVTGPAECGNSNKGNFVVLSRGRMPCEEVIEIANDYEIDNEVEGWNCDVQAVTLSGFTLDFATGRGCSSQNNLVSMYNESIAAEHEASQEGNCGPGEGWVGVWGVPGSERCIPIEGYEGE